MLVMEYMYWAFIRQSMPRKVLIVLVFFGLFMLAANNMAFAADPPTIHPEGGGPGAAQGIHVANWLLWWLQLGLVVAGVYLLFMIPVAIFTDHDRSPLIYIVGLIIAVIAFQKIQDPTAFMNDLSHKLGNG